MCTGLRADRHETLTWELDFDVLVHIPPDLMQVYDSLHSRVCRGSFVGPWSLEDAKYIASGPY